MKISCAEKCLRKQRSHRFFIALIKFKKKRLVHLAGESARFASRIFIRQYKCRYASTAEGALKANGSSASSWKVTYSRASCFAGDSLQQFVIQCMTGFISGKCTNNIVTTHEQVTDRIEHFCDAQIRLQNAGRLRSVRDNRQQRWHNRSCRPGTNHGTADIRYHA